MGILAVVLPRILDSLPLIDILSSCSVAEVTLLLDR